MILFRKSLLVDSERNKFASWIKQLNSPHTLNWACIWWTCMVKAHDEKHRFPRCGVKTIKWWLQSFFCILLSAFQVRSYCSTGKCEKISFDERQRAHHNKELVCHVFHNSVTSNPQQCYLWCINDCRCLSINYKGKNNTKYCELNEGSHFTNNNTLKDIQRSVYYVLRREYSTKVLHFSMPYNIFTTHLCTLHLEMKGV